MNFIIALLLTVVFIFVIALMYVLNIVISKIKILFGYKLYECTRILSYGMKTETIWSKTDEKVLDKYSHFEFIKIVKPEYKTLKPLR